MQAIAPLFHFSELAAQHHVHAPDPHGLQKRVTHIIVETAQGFLAAIDQAHMTAQAVEDMCEFQRDIAAARDQNALGQLVEMEGFVGGDAKLAARDHMAGAHLAGGPVAGGDQDLVCRHAFL